MTKAEKTKGRIIEAAIELFNEKGTKAVTTNHIAARLGISPGNLYYHFRNKEEIIRAIFAQMHEVGLEEYQEVNADGPGSAASMEETFLMIQRFNWRYRFFKRELAALVQSDSELKTLFVASHRLNLAVVRGALDLSIQQGFLKDLPAEQRDLLAEQIWMTALFWLNYLEIGGEDVNEATLQRGSAILRNMMFPYLSDSALGGISTPSSPCPSP
ncbi:TetR/AcrR family transcriptional regulator [Geomesophilobacter sediminis]|uniref:TetR/AcrR family transcriptional regulator n=1 Tax=Geomesophilobacter sediminis TaxID=2798584 RepID=A0A8J7JM65_9BACT|nr:TetR/AcrR family transcriptional regulator [Geomesophilobacter sediminis]MBJ6725555.1 TetR/AcrR family transcriptional regulator [Geomesophilobacter sediminis]